MLLDALDYGVPLSRRRVYLVGVRTSEQSAPLRTPPVLRPGLRLSLADVLAPPDPLDDPEREPGGGALDPLDALDPSARARAVREARAKLPAGGIGDWVIDDSRSYASWGPGGPMAATVAPGVLHSRARGLWLGSRGRRLSFAETARLQGFDHSLLQWPAAAAAAFCAVGHATTVPVVQAIIRELLSALGEEVPPTPWQTGEAQRALRSQGAGAAGPGPVDPGLLGYWWL